VAVVDRKLCRHGAPTALGFEWRFAGDGAAQSATPTAKTAENRNSFCSSVRGSHHSPKAGTDPTVARDAVCLRLRRAVDQRPDTRRSLTTDAGGRWASTSRLDANVTAVDRVGQVARLPEPDAG